MTSVLNMLPKPFLKFWASKVVAEKAVEHLGEIVNIAMRDQAAAIDFLKRSPDRFTAKAADMGTEVHDVYERLARGETLGRVHPDMEPYVRIFESFEKTYKPEFLFLEETVWSETHGYAGSFDWMARVTDPKTKEELVAIGDNKTTRSGVHSEVAIQLAAYKNADYIVRPDGGRVPLPKLEVGLVLHARPEGGKVVPARIDDEVFQVFLHLLEVYKFERELKNKVLGNELPLVLDEPKKRVRG